MVSILVIFTVVDIKDGVDTALVKTVRGFLGGADKWLTNLSHIGKWQVRWLYIHSSLYSSLDVCPTTYVYIVSQMHCLPLSASCRLPCRSWHLTCIPQLGVPTDWLQLSHANGDMASVNQRTGFNSVTPMVIWLVWTNGLASTQSRQWWYG